MSPTVHLHENTQYYDDFENPHSTVLAACYLDLSRRTRMRGAVRRLVPSVCPSVSVHPTRVFDRNGLRYYQTFYSAW